MALSEEQIIQAAQMREEGLSYCKIAAQFYVDDQTVMRSLKARGLFKYVRKPRLKT